MNTFALHMFYRVLCFKQHILRCQHFAALSKCQASDQGGFLLPHTSRRCTWAYRPRDFRQPDPLLLGGHLFCSCWIRPTWHARFSPRHLGVETSTWRPVFLVYSIPVLRRGEIPRFVGGVIFCRSWAVSPLGRPFMSRGEASN